MTGPVLSPRAPSPPTVADPDAVAPAVSDAAGIPTADETEHNATDGVRADIARAGSAVAGSAVAGSAVAGSVVTVVSLAGAVDLASAHVLAAALASAVSAGGSDGRVVLELNRVTFLGACGLGAILAAHADAARRGGAVVLVVDDVAPAAATLRFLPLSQGPAAYSTLTAALHGEPAPRVPHPAAGGLATGRQDRIPATTTTPAGAATESDDDHHHTC